MLYNDFIELSFASNSLNLQTDNLFAKQGDGYGNSNNIERLEVAFQGSLISDANTMVGFAMLESVADNAQAPFIIAAIPSVDLEGNPTSFCNFNRVRT